MDRVPLPPELEASANEALASGRYPSREALLAACVRLLKEAAAEVMDCLRSLEDARTEAPRNGWHGLGQVMAETDEIIASKRDTA